MRVSILFSLVAVLTTVGVNAKPTRTTTNIKRFTLKGGLDNKNLTSAQRYALELTRRSPTRRTTAKKRQTSPTVEEPPELRTVNIIFNYAFNPNFPDDDLPSYMLPAHHNEYGMIFAAEGDTGDTYTQLVSPSWTSNSRQRITIPDSTSSTYTTLGLIQIAGESTTLGPGLGSAVIITGVASGTSPGSPPALIRNQITGEADLGVETDVWNIDFKTGVVSATWINPDGTAVELILVTNGLSVRGTGDVDAMNAGESGFWYPLDMHIAVTGV